MGQAGAGTQSLTQSLTDPYGGIRPGYTGNPDPLAGQGVLTGLKNQGDQYGTQNPDGTWGAPEGWTMGARVGNFQDVTDPQGGVWQMNPTNGYMTQQQSATNNTPQSAFSAIGAPPGLTGDFGALAQSNPLAALNYMSMASMTPPGNNPADTAMGRLFQNSSSPNPAFQSQLLQAMGYNVPTALGSFGTQTSPFGSLTGLGNPGLLTLMLLMANRPTTTVPFDPVVQAGSPDNLWGVMGLNGFPFYPEAGSTLPPWLVPPFIPVPPVPGGASNLPGILPPIGHGPFQPGGGFEFGGEGEGEGGGGEGGSGGQGWTASTSVSSGPRQVKGATDTKSTFKKAGGQLPGGRIDEVRNDSGDIVYSRSDR